MVYLSWVYNTSFQEIYYLFFPRKFALGPKVRFCFLESWFLELFLQKHIEDGFCNFSEMSHPHDIASLLKQFFRELPDSLLSSTLHSCFVKSLQLNTLNEQTTAILLLCLLLPDTHLRLLQYFSRFITQVSNHSEESGMTPSNLAIVLSPNLMFTGKEKDCDKFVKEQTQVVEILFRNSHQIGMVNDEILEKVNTESDANAMSTSSGDELESSLEGRKRRVRRRRSRSISGML